MNERKLYFSSDFTLGILGGGQLGKMLLYETRKYDIQTAVLDPNDDSPCRIASNYFQEGDLMDYDTVLNFGRKADVVTFEIEHVNTDALRQLEVEGKTVYPGADTLRIIQDKGLQKEFYKRNEIPTAPFRFVASGKELTKLIASGEEKLPLVWKSRKGGYDGKGVRVLKTRSDVESLPDIPAMVEHQIDFDKEIAVIVARNPKGEVVTYPPVEMEFHPQANLVEYVLCPARIDEQMAERARAIAVKLSGSLKNVGLLAVEMFLTKSGELLVNESAPRPHNSGHFSIEGSITNQFEQHLRAILDLPLGNTKSKTGAVMVNLVAKRHGKAENFYTHIEQMMAMEGVIPHIYGKKEMRPNRKMGHVTIVNKDIHKAREIAEKVRTLAENQ